MPRTGYTTTDDDFLKAEMFDGCQKSGQDTEFQSATNFKVAKFFSVSVGGSYEDVWTLQTYNKRYDEES